MEVAEAVQRLALVQIEAEIAAVGTVDAAPAEAPRGRRDDPVARIDRATRMARLSLALEARLDEGEPARRARVRADEKAQREAEADARLRAWSAETDAEHDALAAREEAVFEVLEATLQASGMDGKTARERFGQITDRMNQAGGEWEYDYELRPVGAVIVRLAEDFGLTVDWSLWVDEDWAVEEAQTNAEGSPYAAGGAAWIATGGEDPAEDPPEEPVREPVPADGSSP